MSNCMKTLHDLACVCLLKATRLATIIAFIKKFMRELLWAAEFYILLLLTSDNINKSQAFSRILNKWDLRNNHKNITILIYRNNNKKIM